jgi:hypothetical protein
LFHEPCGARPGPDMSALHASSARSCFTPWAECVARCGIVACLAGIAVIVALMGGNDPKPPPPPETQMASHVSEGASGPVDAASSAGWRAASGDNSSNYAAQDAQKILDRDSGSGMRRVIEFVVVPLVPIGIMLALVLMFRKA